MKKAVSASITPLLQNGSLDCAGLQKIFERNIRHGLDGIFILGSMGEWGSFSDAFKLELVRKSSEIIRGRTELLVGINATSLPLSLKLMKEYEQFDFSAYVFMLPGRTSRLDPVRSILTVLDAADRPVYYYHCPPNNQVELSLEQFDAVMKHPNLAGIKNSASNMWLRKELLMLREEHQYPTLFFEGQEWAADEALLVGCDGMICGMGALASKIMTGMTRAADRGDLEELLRLQRVMIRLFHGVYGLHLENVWNGQKYALMKMGLCTSAQTQAQEMDSLTDEAKKRIEDCLAELAEELD